MTDETNLFALMEDDEIKTDEVKDDEQIVLREFDIDFETGLLTGEVVTGVEALKVWAWLALKTARYRYLIYSWQYGSELETLIGSPYSEATTRDKVRTFIESALEPRQEITGISDYTCTFSGDTVTAAFKLDTIYGEEEMEIDV